MVPLDEGLSDYNTENLTVAVKIVALVITYRKSGNVGHGFILAYFGP
jgi:hypothetical protein